MLCYKPVSLRRQLCFAICLSALVLPVQAAAVDVGAEARKDLSLTLYNAGIGLVVDTRASELPAGVSDLAFADVSPQLRPETAYLAGSGLRLVEQSFLFDLISLAGLIEANLGNSVQIAIRNRETGETRYENARLLSASDYPIIERDGRIETISPQDLVFSELPAGLKARPGLVARVNAESAGLRELSLSYLSGGFSWQADYLAELDKAERGLRLTGLVTLTNQSGISFPKARVSLVAGEINLARSDTPIPYESAPRQMLATEEAVGLQAQGLGDQHIYRLPGEVALADSETKQVVLLSSAEVPVEKRFRFEGLVNPYGGAEEIGPVRPQIRLSFRNDALSGLDIPMPGGVLRVYQPHGERGDRIFLGEDRIQHKAAGEKIELTLGTAFDITGRARTTAFERFSKNSYETAQKIEIENAKPEAVEVEIAGDMPPGYEIRQESEPHKQETFQRVVWKIKVPAKGKAELSYSVLVTQP